MVSKRGKRSPSFTGRERAAERPQLPKTPRAKNTPRKKASARKKAPARQRRSQVSCGHPGCDRTFATERGTRQHERSCPNRPAEPVVRKVEAAVRAAVDALEDSPTVAALGEMAFHLARSIDTAELTSAAAARATAAMAKELRALLVELARLGAGDDDDLDDELSTPLPAQVRDATDT